jgi:hypothetical protein
MGFSSPYTNIFNQFIQQQVSPVHVDVHVVFSRSASEKRSELRSVPGKMINMVKCCVWAGEGVWRDGMVISHGH